MAMVKVNKVLRCRIKPEPAQRIIFWKTFGCCRKTWNLLLDERIKSNRELGGVKFKNTTPAHLKKSYKYLNEVDSLALANTQLELNQACKRQFAKGKNPNFKRKGRDKRSYTTNATNNNISKDTKKRINIVFLSIFVSLSFVSLPMLLNNQIQAKTSLF